jgi:hypothetical protein
VRHALASKAAGDPMAVVVGLAEEVEGADTKLPASYESMPL